MTSKTLPLAEVRQWMNAVIDLLERGVGEELSVESARYWTVYFDEAFGDAPPSPVVGDLHEDLEELRQEMAKAADGVAVWHMLHHLSGVVAYLARSAERRGLFVSLDGEGA